MDLSIIIVSFNTKEVTLACLNSIVKNTQGIKYEIIVIDNNSIDGSVEALKKLPNKALRVVENKKNLGFAAANNQGIKAAHGRYLLFLNSDTLIKDDLFREMVAWLDREPEIGIATCALHNKDGSLQGTGGYFPTLLRVFSWMTIEDIPFIDKLIKSFHPLHSKSLFRNEHFYKRKRHLDWLTGAFLLVRRQVTDDIGGWDEQYFMYAEDTDFCFRAKKKGWQIFYNPQWSITHLGGASGTAEFSILSEIKGLKRFYKKFYPEWQYPILRFLFKLGSLGRMLIFGILEGRKAFKIYAKAFQEA
jgi:GT2 family glycosyltransferase